MTNLQTISTAQLEEISQHFNKPIAEVEQAVQLILDGSIEAFLKHISSLKTEKEQYDYISKELTPAKQLAADIIRFYGTR